MNQAWWKHSVVYQIYPRSFQDSNGDGIGDLPGITSRLDHLQQLGVDVVWLSPVYKSPNDDNGYDISDYRDIMDEFGTMADFDTMLAAMHTRGIRLMMDLVVNHTSDEHAWFKQARSSRDNPYHDHYIWREKKEGREPNNWEAAFSGSAWEWNEPTGEYYLHMFSKKQPDLNWDNPKVRADVFEMMHFWFGKGVDGFRMDVINMISKPYGPDGSLPDAPVVRPGFLQPAFGMVTNGPRLLDHLGEMKREVLSRYDCITVGEAPLATVRQGIDITNEATGSLNMLFQFEHMDLDSVGGHMNGKWAVKPLDLRDLKATMSRWQNELHGRGWNSLYLSNHDQPRPVSRFGDDRRWRVESAKMLATWLHLMEGTPYIYQGEELGMSNVPFESVDELRDIESINMYREAVGQRGEDPARVFASILAKGRDNARTPVQWDDGPNAGFSSGTPWIRLNPNHRTVNARQALADENSVFHHYRRLIALRRTHPVIVHGRHDLLLPEHPQIYAYTRTLGDQVLLVVCNFSAESPRFGWPAELRSAPTTLLIGNLPEVVANAARNDAPEHFNLRPYEARAYLCQAARRGPAEDPTMLDDANLQSILQASHGDPFGVLGLHADAAGRWWLRAFLPGASQVQAIAPASGAVLAPLVLRHPEGFYEGQLPGSARPDYRLQVRWADGHQSLLDDPYRFPPVLGEMDVWLMGEGTHLRPYEVLGATRRELLGVAGTSFAVWAPNASRVSVVGDFNMWDGRRHPMRLRRECGVWEIFLPGVDIGSAYKYEVRSRGGQVLPLKADPYALQSELRPATASVVAQMPPVLPRSEARQRANALDAPMSIYEVHLGSWRRKPEEGDRWLNWDELSATLVPYVREMGFTHIELLPVTEHPFDGSWGYQPIGMYAPTSRFGVPEDQTAGRGLGAGFRRFVDACHAQGIGVLLDWVPAHFPTDAHGLANFDGTHLYEYADPREGFHQDWNTLIYNLGRTEVRNFLVGNALYWLERYGIDGLRVDAVASMLYRDYSRRVGEWVPNAQGGRENLEAIAFLKRMNEVIGAERGQAVTLAEESTAFPAVSRPTYAGGLGFHYKWNMGWMHDTLQYMARDPVHRRYHHGEMSFGLVYAFNENFVLPISHDEVVHGKGSLLNKMPGDRWQQFANLRAYYGFMYGHPGKKLLFMGCEFAQEREWNHDQSLDWHLLGDGAHAGVKRLLQDLNGLYKATPALYERDFVPDGFEWIEHEDAQRSVLSFIRRGHAQNSLIVVVCNFTPTVQHGYRLGVPQAGLYQERINTDSDHYGGSNVGAPFGEITAEPVPWNGKPHSIALSLPPLATVFFEWNG